MTSFLYAESPIVGGLLRHGAVAGKNSGLAARQSAWDDRRDPAIADAEFNALMTIIGPAGRDEFLSCLLADLRNACSGLHRAARSRDGRAARQWGHALIGLAGTVGAMKLLELVRGFNQRLASGSLDGALRDLPDVQAEIDRLIRFCTHAANPEAVY